MREPHSPRKTYQDLYRQRLASLSGSGLGTGSPRSSSSSNSRQQTPRLQTGPATPPCQGGMSGERGSRGEPSSTLHSLEDVVPSAAPPTLTGLEDASAATPTAVTPTSGAAQASPGGRYGTPPRQHYLLSTSSETSSLGSDGSGTPLQPAPLPAVTLPMVPAAATTDSSESSFGLFGTPRSRVSDAGSAGSADVEASRTQHLLSQRSSSPLRNESPVRTAGRSGSPARQMVAAGVMGSSISLQPRQQQTPQPLTQQRSPLATASRASPAQLDSSGGGAQSSTGPAPAAFSSSIAVPALGVAAAGAATAAAAKGVLDKRSSSGAGSAGGEAAGSGGGTPPKPPAVRASRSSGAGSSSSKTGRKGAKGSQQAAGEIAPEATSSRQAQPQQQQQQSSAVAALTADIIAAAAAGAAAGAALAAIAEVGEDQQQRQLQQQQQKDGGEGVVSPRVPSSEPSPRGKQLGATQATPPGFSVLDPAAAAAAAKSARRRSKSSRSRATSAAGGKGGDIAAAADIEQPAPQLTPRVSRARSSSGGAKKTLLGSLAALLGVAAWKRGAASQASPVTSASPSSFAETPSSQSGEPAPSAKEEAAAKAAPPIQPDTRRKWVKWGLLALCVLALLFGVALAIGMTVSKQNADKRARAMTSPAGKGPKGPPLTFKVDVDVPPDDDPTAPPICGSMFGAASPGSNKKVESFLTVFKKSYASALKIKPNEVGISSVSCNNKPVQGASQPAAPSPPEAATPRPAHKRLLLSDVSQGPPHRHLAAATQSGAAAAAPATLSTEFQVPAPADPAEREKLAAQVKESSQAVLTGPLSEFFGRPVSVRPPVQLAEPTRKSQTTTTAPVPRVARPVPGPEPETEPSNDAEGEVPAEAEELPDARPPTKTARSPVPSPKPRPVQSPAPKPEETPTLPLQLPKPARSPKPATPPVVNGTRPSPSPTRALPSPRPKDVLPSPSPKPQKPVAWSTAPSCKFKADGQNSVPDTEGRLWGWQNGESCTFKTLFRTPIYITWSNAPTCKDQPTTSNSVYDRSGRLWGWQDDRSCSFRGTRIQQTGDPSKPVLTWPTAPSCKGSPNAMNSVKTRAGELWGWENSSSCAFRIHDDGISWSTAPRCKGLANYYNSVRDSLGRPWGWEDNRSCRF